MKKIPHLQALKETLYSMPGGRAKCSKSRGQVECKRDHGNAPQRYANPTFDPYIAKFVGYR